jgi:aspartyl-tRNA(Asn)/glutamyl-tRNA(Gln) amidotransferase subunit A
VTAPLDQNLADLALALRRREVSSEEVTRAALARIASLDPTLGAFLALDEPGAIARAREIDRCLARGEEVGPLAGVPVAVKDNLLTRGLETTAGSRILRGFRPTFDATAVERLRRAGAVLLGKTNCDEFAMGSSSENSAYRPVRNPWDPRRVPGGSSGGSAAAVAARLVFGALGSDTGGSIRQPAALTGVVGLKPTYGRVSRYGLIAFASSLDQVGPLTRTVRDCALLLQAIAGHDPRDSTSLEAPVPDYAAALGGDLRGLRLGVPRESLEEGVDPEVRAAIARSLETLRDLGAEVREISLSHSRYGIAAYYLIATAEASSNLARYDGVRYGHRAPAPRDLGDLYARTRTQGFGPEVKRRIMLGTYALSAGYYEAYYLRAQKVRTLVCRDFEEAFREVDLVAGPTSPTPAFLLGERTSDPLQMYLADVFTVPCNLAGLPGLSVPCGFTAAGLPVGLQLLGRPLDEATLLRTAHAYEQATGWHLRPPPLGSAP